VEPLSLLSQPSLVCQLLFERFKRDGRVLRPPFRSLSHLPGHGGVDDWNFSQDKTTFKKYLEGEMGAFLEDGR